MGSPVKPEAVSPLDRVLSPDEFAQARQMSPDALDKWKIPPAPVLAPKDAVRRANPLTPPDPGKPMPGLAGILTRQIVNPVLNHPVMTGAVMGASMLPVIGPAIGYGMMGMMGKDVLDYSAQKAAELQLPPDIRAIAEQDPDRVSGESAGVNAAFLALSPIVRSLREMANKSRPAPPPGGGSPPEGVKAVLGLKSAEELPGNGTPPGGGSPAESAPAGELPGKGAPAGDVPAEAAPTGPQQAEWDAMVERRQRIIAQDVAAGRLTHQEGAKELLDMGQRTLVGAQTRAKVEQHVAGWVDAVKAIVAPTTRGPDALLMSNIIRAHEGHGTMAYEQAFARMDGARRALDPLPEADKYAFIDAIEGGRSQPTPEFQPFANAMRGLLDGARDEIIALGTGKLDTFYTNYFPRIWKDPKRAEEVFADAGARSIAEIASAGGRGEMVGKRPFEGSKSFLKQRTLDTFADGIARGLEPISSNPVDLFLLKYREMQRYLAAHRAMKDAHEAGMLPYVRSGQIPPEGYAPINDKIATVFGPRTVPMVEAVDADLMASLETYLSGLGVKFTRAVKLKVDGKSKGILGFAQGDQHIASKAGTDLGVVMHEIGHTLDVRFGLGDQLRATAESTRELAAIAEWRIRTGDSQKQIDYIQNPKEQVANALHAFLQAPDRMEAEAPTLFKTLQGALEKDPGMAPLLDLKRGTAFQLIQHDIQVPGTRIMGQYYAPEPAALILNNHLSPGLRGNPIYDAYRAVGNTLNQAQLGLSQYHLGFTSMDATMSRAALGLQYFDTALRTGDLGAAWTGATKVASAPFAPLSGIAQGFVGDFVNAKYGTNFQWGLGAKIRQAYLAPETAAPEFRELAMAVADANGRVTMDSDYKNSSPEKMIHAWRTGAFGSATHHFFPAIFEFAAKPLMEHTVPLQKIQVFGEMAQKILAELPPGAGRDERRAAMSKAWDSVDNRMGQLVYDNLFWNRAFRDMAMASVRSLGWNVGTEAEIGGGLLDVASAAKAAVTPGAASPALTHKAAYVMALPVVAGLYGATYQYLRTGEGPSELKDYFYPKNGAVDADGNPERSQLPTYMKDVASYRRDPVGTVLNKTSPSVSLIMAMLRNQDFYGDQIRNPDDPAVKQAMQEARYVLKAAVPFTIRNANELVGRGDPSMASKAANFFGITPAPRAAVRSDAQNAMAEIVARRGKAELTPEQRESADARRAILAGLRGNTGVDLRDAVTHAVDSKLLSEDDIARLIRRAQLSPAQERFRSLSYDDALRIFLLAERPEQERFADILAKKIARQPKE